VSENPSNPEHPLKTYANVKSFEFIKDLNIDGGRPVSINRPEQKWMSDAKLNR
jgi:hypothetical protein